MYRAEIIANQSVQDDIIELLEESIPELRYTLIPLAHGKGDSDYKLGNGTWPETNFVFVSYIADSEKDIVRAVVSAIKKRFSNEGITLFFVKAEE